MGIPFAISYGISVRTNDLNSKVESIVLANKELQNKHRSEIRDLQNKNRVDRENNKKQEQQHLIYIDELEIKNSNLELFAAIQLNQINSLSMQVEDLTAKLTQSLLNGRHFIEMNDKLKLSIRSLYENNTYATSIVQLTETLNNHRKEKSMIEEEIVSLNRQLNEPLQEKRSISDEMDKCKARIVSLNTQLSQLNNFLLAARSAQRRATHSEYNRYSVSISNTETKIKEGKELLEELNKTYSELLAKIVGVNSIIDKYNLEMNSLKSKISIVNRKIDETQDKINRYRELTKMLDSLLESINK
jgi:chromosome segregation ATPase